MLIPEFIKTNLYPLTFFISLHSYLYTKIIPEYPTIAFTLFLLATKEIPQWYQLFGNISFRLVAHNVQ